MASAPESPPDVGLRWLAALTGLVWLTMVAIDFFLHAGLLASLYSEPSPFLLPRRLAFALIPVGYAAFVLLAVLVVWLTRATHEFGIKRGFFLGAKVGALAWGAFTMGLASISTASPILLFGWFLGQTVELAVGGAAAGYAIAQGRLRPLAIRTGLLLLASLLLTILLQSLGLAPAAKSG